MIEICDPGLLATVQDLGRPGFAHLGVPRSGALDAPALRLANRLAGNAEGAAGVEFTMTGGTVRFARPAVVAVTGAPAVVTVIGQAAAGDGRAADPGVTPVERARPPAPGAGGRTFRVPHSQAVHVRAGDTLVIGPALARVRGYLAVGGGIDVPEVLGSRSTDTLSGLGPAPLRAGDTLPLGAPAGAPVAVDFVPIRAATGVLTLRLHPGPRDDWFDRAGWRALAGAAYTVSPVSNRVGARLAGPAVTRVAPGRELPSEGVVLGAVQVTADGTPLVFLADHPTTGGYPVVGVVDPADLPLVAQARPGDVVAFRLVGRPG